MKNITSILLFTVCMASAAIGQTQAAYLITKSFPIKSAGGYDYLTVDSMSNNLYISHGSQVNVLDKTTGDSIGVILAEKDVHGIALVHELGKGYVTNGMLNSVLVFDLKTNKVLGHVPAGKFADGIMYDDFSKKVYSSNGMSKNLTVIDPASDQAVATIQLTGWPETATSDGAGKVYVNNSEKSEVDVIDAKTYQIIHTWPIAPGKGSSGISIDRETMRLFIGCGNKLLIVMDATNGKVIAQLPIGDECDAVGFDKRLKVIYSSNGEGTLTIIKEWSAEKFTVIQDLKTQKGARTNAVDQITHSIYLPAAEFKAQAPGSFRPSVIPGTFKILEVNPG
jgi:DNA-binding beta-propeller fold protein YncE